MTICPICGRAHLERVRLRYQAQPMEPDTPVWAVIVVSIAIGIVLAIFAFAGLVALGIL